MSTESPPLAYPTPYPPNRTDRRRRERIETGNVEGKLSDREQRRRVDAELLEDVALDLGDAHFEHHLFLAQHVYRTYDPLLAFRADKPGRQIKSKLGFGRRLGPTAEDDILADRVDGYPGAGNGPPNKFLQGNHVLRHFEVESQDLLAACIKEENVGLADGAGEQISGVLGAHHRIDDVGVTHEHVASLAWQLDDDRLVEADAHEAAAIGARRIRSKVAGGCRLGNRPGRHQRQRCREQQARPPPGTPVKARRSLYP